jgi:hypothetical protein
MSVTIISTAIEDAEISFEIQRELEMDREDQFILQQMKPVSVDNTIRRELEPLECDHEFETVDKLSKHTALHLCVVCDQERVIELAKQL